MCTRGRCNRRRGQQGLQCVGQRQEHWGQVLGGGRCIPCPGTCNGRRLQCFCIVGVVASRAEGRRHVGDHGMITRHRISALVRHGYWARHLGTASLSMPRQARFAARLSQALFDFVVQLLPPDAELAIKDDVRLLLQRLLRTLQPDAVLLAFGSTANGFSLRNSGLSFFSLAALDLYPLQIWISAVSSTLPSRVPQISSQSAQISSSAVRLSFRHSSLAHLPQKQTFTSCPSPMHAFPSSSSPLTPHLASPLASPVTSALTTDSPSKTPASSIPMQKWTPLA